MECCLIQTHQLMMSKPYREVFNTAQLEPDIEVGFTTGNLWLLTVKSSKDSITAQFNPTSIDMASPMLHNMI
jgi:hypothetical protein